MPMVTPGYIIPQGEPVCTRGATYLFVLQAARFASVTSP